MTQRVQACLLCIGLGSGAAASSVAAGDGTVSVLYAGSLVYPMEHSIGPAFERETGLRFSGYAAGSNKLANEIKGKLRRGDVFISASPKANASLTGIANGDWVRWYVHFADSPLQIGYNPRSKFAGSMKTGRWDQVLQKKGIRIGRTDPKLDPKGAFTVELVTRAAEFYKEPDLPARILGAPDNPEQVLPEEILIGRFQSGQLDVAFFYSTEVATMKIPSIHVPPEITPKANYTITILNKAANPQGAGRFVSFLSGPQGQALLRQNGIDLIAPSVTGDKRAVPASLRPMLDPAQ